ncbi:Eco57I restriction-modification methylase domain-containing protein [Capnocytophaga periodontitidis]|uniref:Eco57I restriction-modification methylase domain-containing protein n=1 Tax=Capnocytophaga periodontitidis TaxID=2795027 RepID=UPI0018E0DB17|nr:N-6 DNA methylase [Capnocytophaga periodontitidis]MBI1667619.1 N-6 DNA methylase [Capnocytophaga periodontitidis]
MKDLIQILSSPYRQEDWISFLKELFAHNSGTGVILQKPQRIELSKSEKVKEAYELGNYETTEGRLIGIYQVNISEDMLLYRNKVGLRQLMKNIYKYNVDGVLVVFVQENKWRLSYISEIIKEVDEKGKIIKEITNEKRFTYLLGEGEKTKTATDRLQLLVGKELSLEDFKNAFAVEALNNDFFDRYKDIYEDFVQHITGVRYEMDKKTKKYIEIKKHEPHPNFDGYKNYKDYPMPHPDSETQPFKNKEYPNLFNGNKKAVRDFVKRMMGRIVFLYFIQKKGWLAVPKGKNWGEGNYDYLCQLYKETPKEDQPYFYEKRLLPLFFECFTDKKSESETNNLRFPYLNGGLFDKTQDQHFDKVNLPYSIFTELFDTFNSYNFTVYEDAPNEHTVAVDPEMLGHIFENLLEDNKDKGAFYTPKEIVHYMCKESLKTFLLSKIVSDNNQSEKAKDVITKIIEHQPLNEEERKYIKEKGNVITTSLENVKICDPAIGSGAFPMGLLQEIYYIKITLQQLGVTTEQTDAQIKKHIIEQNIYGVDIDAGAVDIARLRFWLSLVVDEQLPQPLPNLDFKIMQGNSLLESYHGVDLSNLLQDNNNLMLVENAQKDLFGNYVEPQLRITFTKKDFTESLQQDIKKYFSITDAETKKSLKKQINNKIQEHIDYNLELRRNHLERLKLEITPKYKNTTLTLKQEREKESLEQEIAKLDISRKEIIKLQETDEKPFFLWHIYFADVFKGANNLDNSGFDIVIGNPPYGAKLSQEDKEVLKKKYISAQTIKGIQKGSLDTYTLFIELGYNLLKKGGNLGFIVPISITSSEAVTGIHKLLRNNCRAIKLSSYAVRPKPVFENAMVNTSIIQYVKTNTPCESILSTKMYRRGKNFNLEQLINNLEFVETKDLMLLGRIPKISYNIERNILTKILNQKTISKYLSEKGSPIYYRAAGGRYFKVVTNYSTGSSAEKMLLFSSKLSNSIGGILSSNLSFWFYQIYSDNLNWKSYEIENFTIPYLNDKDIVALEKLYQKYLADIENNAKNRTVTEDSSYHISEFKEYKIQKSKHIIDQIDDLICPLYGLTQEEIDFIKNYEIEFRLSDND